MRADMAASRFSHSGRGTRTVARWLLAVAAMTILELAALVALLLWTLADFASSKLRLGGAVAFVAVTILAIWWALRLLNVILEPTRRGRGL